jgi:FTR1 family protein
MLATAAISFREFFEAFLIVGMFLGVSRKLGLKREIEIGLAAAIGLAIAVLMASSTYFFSDQARGILTESNSHLLESYLLIFSGVFIAYVVFTLHDAMNKNRKDVLNKAQKQLFDNVFDVSLFLTIIILIVREGFEISLFSASSSLFSGFMQNFLGLLAGLAGASVLGMSTVFAFVRLPIDKVFQWTKYLIVLLGASMTQNGITQLFDSHFAINLSDIGPLPLGFLPAPESTLGHLLQGLIGVDANLSIVRLGIMVAYVAVVYLIFMGKHNPATSRAVS